MLVDTRSIDAESFRQGTGWEINPAQVMACWPCSFVGIGQGAGRQAEASSRWMPMTVAT